MCDSDHTDIYLCLTEVERNIVVHAVYDNELEAEAWQQGVESAYMTGYVMCARSDQGRLNIRDWLTEVQKGE